MKNEYNGLWGGDKMDKVIVVLASYTSAYSVQLSLERKYGVLSKIVRSPSELSKVGCSYCLEFDRCNLENALKLIRSSSISIRGIYDAATLKAINL